MSSQMEMPFVPANTDWLFPLLALEHLGTFAVLVFIVGLTASTFSSADGVLTTLTTSFCVDFLKQDANAGEFEQRDVRRRRVVHVGFALLLWGTILVFKAWNSDAVINLVLRLAGYTYGPLLGLFAFGLFCRAPVRDSAVPWACLWPPVVCGLLQMKSADWFGGYRFGFELLILNGLLTMLGLWILVQRPGSKARPSDAGLGQKSQ